MIIDKHTTAPGNIEENQIPQENYDVTLEEVENNALVDVYLAARRTLEALHINPNDINSPKLFQTVKLDNGQFDRIIRSRGNTEYAVGFPAVFIRFVNVRYLVQQQRIGEGRATMRVRFILNNLNNSDDDIETEGFKIFQRINIALQDAKDYEPAFNERLNLTFFDMPEIQDNGLQAFWIDYEIWFRENSAFQYRNWITRYLVAPPFTNHSDAPEHDTEGHGNHTTPTYDDATRLELFKEFFDFILPARLN
jgi:hypothetical protein